jgi:hypothetical protein
MILLYYRKDKETNDRRRSALREFILVGRFRTGLGSVSETEIRTPGDKKGYGLDLIQGNS